MMSSLVASLGSRNIQRSVLSATGSWLMSGASRWLEAEAGRGTMATAPNVIAAQAAASSFPNKMCSLPLMRVFYGATRAPDDSGLVDGDDLPGLADGCEHRVERLGPSGEGDGTRPTERVGAQLGDEVLGGRAGRRRRRWAGAHLACDMAERSGSIGGAEQHAHGLQ